MALSLIARMTVISLALLSLLIAGGRLLPQTPPNLEDYSQLFMTSAACDTPCLMGIRQGMLLSEAAEILEAHDWVERVYTRRISQFESRAFWIWSGNQPDFIDLENRGLLYARSGQSHDIRQLVYQVQVSTNLRFQDLYMALGETDDGLVQYWPDSDMIAYDIHYRDSENQSHISLYTPVDCPAQLVNVFWQQHTAISQIFGSPLDQFASPQQLSTVCRNEGNLTAGIMAATLE